MAEEGIVCELEGLEKQLQSLLSRYSSEEQRADSKTFCSDFRKLVEEYASRWQVPLPQLGILEMSLCYFARASTFFASSCDHVLNTLSSLALSVFELLLFFDPKDFNQEILKQFTVTFQECHSVLSRHQNVHLLQVEHLIRAGGPWASPVLHAILSESSLPQSEVDGCISSELPVFFELRVRYLLSCEQRVGEAMALAKCCARHPTAGQHLFFLQVYLRWLSKTSQQDSLQGEVVDLNGKDAVHIICSLECEEKDELLLILSRAFLSQQLRRGDMLYLCDLVSLWSKLHSRLNTSKQALLAEGHQLMLSATNVNSIFPFIKAILLELGGDGIQFCVELCANALESCLSCDVITKSLIYKTIAGLLPNDLEVCRACALLVFFLERTVEAYKMVYLLYMHPDQEYHVEHSPIRNHVRFETLQILKKGLYFDPEFWNLIALRTNCLKLMSEKVVSSALEEIMEDKWIHNYCTKEPASKSTSVCKKGRKGQLQAASKKRHHKEDRHNKEDTDNASKKLKVGPGKTRINVDHTVKRRANQGSRPLKDASSQPLRRSYWQLDRLRDNVAVGYGELRRTTRLSEKNPTKRKIRKPKWLLEDSGTLEENIPRFKKHRLKHQKHHQSCVVKRSETGQIKNNAKDRTSKNSRLMARENNKHQKELSLDCPKPATHPQVILELSLPDNELMGTFTEDSCNRPRGFPQVLFYRPTVKLPATPQPMKTLHRKEVVLTARDPTMFVQLMHCYARRQRGNGNGSNIQGSRSTITRSSVQGSPPKDPQRELCENPAAEIKGRNPSRTPASVEATVSLVKAQTTKAVSRKTSSARELFKKSAAEMKVTVGSQIPAPTELTKGPVFDKVLQAQPVASARELCEVSAVEMKVTIASQTPTAAKVTDKVSKAETVKDNSTIASSTEISKTSTIDHNQLVVADEITAVVNLANIYSDPSQSQDDVLRDQKVELKSLFSLAESCKNPVPDVLTTFSNSISKLPCENDTKPGGTVVTVIKTEATCRPIDQDSINDIPALTLVTELVTELAPETIATDPECHTPAQSGTSESTAENKSQVLHKLYTSSSCSDPGVSAVAGMKKEGTQDVAPETPDNSDPMETEPESEESCLEYCCTFCNKVFRGSRVVAHAMFHYRKDECMFCGTMFKDDLLAMMHLSDHIEKLKKIKGSAASKAQENCVSETKDIPSPKTSAKVKTRNVSPGLRSSGRSKTSAIHPKSQSLPDSTTSRFRKPRSNEKPEDGPSLQRHKQNTSKHHSSITPVHKVNGHIGKKKELDRAKKAKLNLEAKQPLAMNSATSVHLEGCSTEVSTKEMKSLQVLEATTKQDGEVVESNVEMLEKVSCPVDGCTWFRDLSKNRVALLYHALEDHYGEVKPLELAFHVASSRCSICMRVMWSFEHFQHHIERHRLTPRHPCLHQGCTARFKSGMEMRRHTRRHSPLQAVCCVPGCPQLFICLWALNLHEREHYASKPTKPDKNTNEQKDEKHNTPVKTKQRYHKIKKGTSTTSVNKTVSVKAASKSRRQDKHKLSTGKHATAPSPTTIRASLLKQELAENNQTKDSHVLKNLSNKGTSAQLTGPNLRLRQTLRKVRLTNTTLTDLKCQKVMSSSLRQNLRVRQKFQKKLLKVKTKGPERRGRPPKSKKAVHDENTTTGQSNEPVKENTDLLKDQTSPATENSMEETSRQVQDVDKSAETSIDESMSKKSVSKQIKKTHVKQKGVSRNSSTAVVTAKSSNQTVTTTSADKTQKSITEELKKVHKVKKRSTPKENSSVSASLDSSKSRKRKITNNKANTEIVKKKRPVKAPEPALKKHKKQPIKDPESASKKPAESKSIAIKVEAKAAVAECSADEEGKKRAENTDSTQSGDSVTAVPANSYNGITTPPADSGEETQRVNTQEKSKKSQRTKKDGKKEKIPCAFTDAGKTNKKHKDIKRKGDNKTVKERMPRKDARKTSALKQTTKSTSTDEPVEPEAAVKNPPDVEAKAKEETLDATPVTSDSSVPPATASGSNETASPPAATEENTETVAKKENSKKSNVKKNPDPSKANKKRKDVHKEGDAKNVRKKKCKDQGVQSVPKKTASSDPEVRPLTAEKSESVDSSVGVEAKESTETTLLAVGSIGYSMLLNGKGESEDVKSKLNTDTLAEYGKRPFMRLPPTAYLDERFITMPKRRKLLSSQRNHPPEQARATTALQRQRCVNCFATFSSAEELQGHLHLQKCSNLFGFDSDDEGNS